MAFLRFDIIGRLSKPPYNRSSSQIIFKWAFSPQKLLSLLISQLISLWRHLRHGTRIFQTAGTSEMLKDENFLFVCHFPGGSASWENIANLNIFRLRLKKVQKWQGIFSLVQVLAEALLIRILLAVRTCSDRVGSQGMKIPFYWLQVLIIISDLKVTTQQSR